MNNKFMNNNYTLSAKYKKSNIDVVKSHQYYKNNKSEYIPLEDYYSVYDKSSFLYEFLRSRKNYEYILNYSANILISFRRNSIIFKERIGFNILIVSFRKNVKIKSGKDYDKNGEDKPPFKIIDKWSLKQDDLDTYTDLFNFFNVYRIKKWLFASNYTTKKWLFNSLHKERPKSSFIVVPEANSVLSLLGTGEIKQKFVNVVSKKQLKENKRIIKKSLLMDEERLDKYYYTKIIDTINFYNYFIDEKKGQKFFFSSIKSRLITCYNGQKKFIYKNIITLYFYWTIIFIKWFYTYYIKILFITWTRFLYNEFNKLYKHNIFYNYYLYKKYYLYANNISTFSLEQYSYFYSDRYKNMGIRSSNVFKNQRFWILDSLSSHKVTDFTTRKFNTFFLFIKRAKKAKGYNITL